MISDELRKYIDMVNEEESNDQLYEMAMIGENLHGIADLYIWIGIGISNKSNQLRIKISNVKNRFSHDNNFVIRMPDMDYDQSQVAGWITADVMNKIMKWINLNYELLYDYEKGLVDDTFIFLTLIVSV